MSNKHYKNRIRILNDYQATKDPNFKNVQNRKTFK